MGNKSPTDRSQSKIDRHIALEKAACGLAVNSRPAETVPGIVEDIGNLQPQRRTPLRNPEAVMTSKIDTGARRDVHHIVGRGRRSSAMNDRRIQLQMPVEGRFPVEVQAEQMGRQTRWPPTDV